MLNIREIAGALGIASLLFSACAGKTAGDVPSRRVRPVAALEVTIPDEVAAFGSLSYLRKVEVTAPNDATVASLPFREGDRVGAGAVIARLESQQLLFALSQAEDAVSAEKAAVDLARTRLRDGEFQAEARILNLAKLGAELGGKRRELLEAERKAGDQEILFAAGGLSEEGIRDMRFSLGSKREEIALLERELEIQSVGLRDADLERAGLGGPSGAEASGEGGLSPEERLRRLVRLSTESLRAELGAADARLEAAGRALDAARLAVAELTIRSPIDSVVGARKAEESERVKREDPLVTLIDVRSLYAVVSLGEQDALRLSRGAEARITVDALGRCLSGSVDTIAPIGDSQSSSFSVRVLLRGESGVLRPGMFARVSIRAGAGRPALVIPESALLRESGLSEGALPASAASPGLAPAAGGGRDSGPQGGKVYSVAGGLVRSREVKLGALWPEGREVVSGLAAGELVVDRPDSALAEGEHVEIEG